MKAIVVFDGVCNLCNGAVRFIVKRDRKRRFQFAWLQSASGREWIQKYDEDAGREDSIVLVYGDKVFTRSSAVLQIFKILGGGWRLLYFFIVIPKGMRDAMYDFIARNRYKWFGKKASCELPDGINLRDRFVDWPDSR